MVNQAPALDHSPAPIGPPVATTGLVGWLRKTFFSSPLNTALTLFSLALLFWAIPPIIDWAFITAVWRGEAAACRVEAAGACWAFVGEKLNFIFYGFFPEAERWRPTLSMAMLLAMVVVSCVKPFWNRRLLVNIWGGGLIVMFFLMTGGVFGLEEVPTRLWGGMPVTMMLAVVGILFAYPLGVVLALGRRSQMPIVRMMCVGYIELIRGVPLITILFMSSLIFPLLLPQGMTFDKLLRAQVAIILFAAAYMAENVRGGLQALPRGQYEAADSLGLSYWMKMRLIVLPQALKIVIPTTVSTFIGFFKDTTLVIIIGIFDFLNTHKAALTDPAWLGFHIEAYVFAASVYFVACFGMSRYSMWLERELSPERKGMR
jgi:general L-amino acid transport system permease protein